MICNDLWWVFWEFSVQGPCPSAILGPRCGTEPACLGARDSTFAIVIELFLFTVAPDPKHSVADKLPTDCAKLSEVVCD